VPVVIVGNITVGGSGKTPLTLWLVSRLKALGRRPGIISRGYGGSVSGVSEVCAIDDPSRVGDEPLLLARRADCPVFVGTDRAAAGRALLAAYPDCDMIISDDGLQHYRLARDFEIAVLDRRLLMNGLMLPAGPLREPVWRLAGVGALVMNGEVAASVHGVPTFDMRLEGTVFSRLDEPESRRVAAEFAGLKLHAVAGIGDPQRFFDHLSALGLSFVPHAFPDHYAYTSSDLDFSGDAILTTEKDAVKFADRAALPVWILPVDAALEPDLAHYLLEKLDGCPPA
jgi:tetraacyldisaccharide 4'-kinase